MLSKGVGAETVVGEDAPIASRPGVMGGSGMAMPVVSAGLLRLIRILRVFS